MDTRTKAALAEWAYDMDESKLPGGYALIARSRADDTGYQGAAIGRPDPHASTGDAQIYSEILVVNRGTDWQERFRDRTETLRDAHADIAILAEQKTIPHLESAAKFFLDVTASYGEPSGIRVDVTGHSLGGAAAYYQRAAAIEARLPADAWPEVETFGALNDAGTIGKRFPHVTPDQFATAINHVRIDDRWTGPYGLRNAMPALGQNVLLPRDRSAEGLLGSHDISSPRRHFESEALQQGAGRDALWSNLRPSAMVPSLNAPDLDLDR